LLTKNSIGSEFLTGKGLNRQIVVPLLQEATNIQ